MTTNTTDYQLGIHDKGQLQFLAPYFEDFCITLLYKFKCKQIVHHTQLSNQKQKIMINIDDL
jgi:hypothetical protein